MVKEGNHGLKYAMFWDFENMMLAGEILDIFLNDLSHVITNLCTKRAERLRAECYGRWGLVSDETQETLSNFGFHLIQIPKVGDNALDTLLIANALIVAKETQCTHFILIAADGDYCKLCAELCEQQVSVSIIARAGNFSSDYLALPLKTYFVDKSGHLFENVIKDKVAQVQLIEEAMKDAGAALGNLRGLAQNAGVQVFSYAEWEEQYRKLETPAIPLSQLVQVLPIAEFFRCFIKVRGFSPSRNLTHFYCGTQGRGETITDVDIIQKLPPSCIISTPVDPGFKLVVEINGEPAKNPGTERDSNDPILLLQPEYIQMGKEVFEELLQIHPTYKYLLFHLFWATMQQRSKVLADLALPTKKVPVEFFQTVIAGDSRVAMNKTKQQWDVLDPVSVIRSPVPQGYACPVCHHKFKSDQARLQHQTSGIHSKIPCNECNRTFHSAQALADHLRVKHKK